MNFLSFIWLQLKLTFWPSSSDFFVYYFPKLPDSPALTTCTISDDVINKLLMQANLFWDNSIIIQLNLLCEKLHASSSFQSKDIVEADLPPPFHKTRFKKPTWNRPNLSMPAYSSMTTLKLLSSIFTVSILCFFTETRWI